MVLTHQNLKNAQYEARTIRITESNGTAVSSIEAMMCATMIYDDHQAEYAGLRPEPRHYHDIAKRPDAVRWYAACDDEIKKLFDMGAFDIVDTPKDKKIMEGVFSFKTKYDSEGNVLKYAARGNVNGSKQQPGTFGDTFALTGKFSCIQAYARQRHKRETGSGSGARISAVRWRVHVSDLFHSRGLQRCGQSMRSLYE